MKSSILSNCSYVAQGIAALALASISSTVEIEARIQKHVRPPVLILQAENCGLRIPYP